MSHNAIPTTYGGVNFRSRLEAKWAAFFDLAGWRWEYEPVDFNGWIPDFVLIGRTRVVYCEVKPVYRYPVEVGEKIHRSGCLDDVVIIGASNPMPADHECFPRALAMGWFAQHTWRDDLDQDWEKAIYFRWLDDPVYTLTFFPAMGHPVDRIDGRSLPEPGSEHLVSTGTLGRDLTKMWREATNRVQWKPSAHRTSARLVWQRES